MKRTVLFLALAAAVFAACEKSDDVDVKPEPQDPCPIAKISFINYWGESAEGPFSKYLEVAMQPSYDALSRLSAIKQEVWGMTIEQIDTTNIYHFLKDLDETVSITYNPDHTGKMVYKGKTFSYTFPDGVVTPSENSHDIEIPITFNEDWYILRTDNSTYEYEYADGYLQEHDVTWQDGDLMTFGQYSFTYSDEPNQFKNWIDYSMGGTGIPEDFMFGLMGKHSAHIPATITDEESMAPLTTITVTKDSLGRITQLRYDRECETASFSTLEIQYK